MINRREFTAALAGVSTGAASANTSQTRPSARPNIVYFILDDLGMYDTGCYGSKQIQTPNIDRLAASGMRFLQAYSGCTVCAPARATLMTGKHMGHSTVRANPGGVSLQASDVTLAEMLTKAGYACAGFGKWGLGDIDTPGVPEKHGFEKFYGYYHQVHAHNYFPDYLIDSGRKAPLPGNANFYRSKPPAGAFDSLDTESGLKRQFSAHLIFDEMTKWLKARDSAKPFFCYAPFTIPHGSHEIAASDPAWRLYKDKPWPVAARVHAAFVTMADRFVGETMNLLREAGQDSNTLVLFSSDNGAAETFNGSLDSGGSLRGKKTEMHEGGIRIPLIAAFPGKIKPGSTSSQPVYFPDIMPTIADFTGTGKFMPAAIDGESFADTAMGRSARGRRRPMYWEWNEDHFKLPYRVTKQACRKGNWKIVRNDIAKPWELYDLSKDPSERNDLAPAKPAIVKELDAWVTANRVDPPEQIEPSKPKGQRWR